MLVKKAPGVSTAAALAAVKTVTKDYPGTTIQNEAQFEAQTAQPINQILNLIYVLMLLAVIIALLGIGNTLALSIYGDREIGLLRAVGMTRRQLRSVIRLESVVIALQGTVLGLLIGVLFGWAIVHAINIFGTGVVSIPYQILAAVVILAAIGGVVTAIRPARRAAKRLPRSPPHLRDRRHVRDRHLRIGLEPDRHSAGYRGSDRGVVRCCGRPGGHVRRQGRPETIKVPGRADRPFAAGGPAPGIATSGSAGSTPWRSAKAPARAPRPEREVSK